MLIQCNLDQQAITALTDSVTGPCLYRIIAGSLSFSPPVITHFSRCSETEKNVRYINLSINAPKRDAWAWIGMWDRRDDLGFKYICRCWD